MKLINNSKQRVFCNTCSKEFSNKYSLCRHTASVDCSNKKTFCDKCGYKAKYPYMMKCHTNTQTGCKNISEPTSSDPKLTCKYCNHVFSSEQYKNMHEFAYCKIVKFKRRQYDGNKSVNIEDLPESTDMNLLPDNVRAKYMEELIKVREMRVSLERIKKTIEDSQFLRRVKKNQVITGDKCVALPTKKTPNHAYVNYFLTNYGMDSLEKLVEIVYFTEKRLKMNHFIYPLDVARNKYCLALDSGFRMATLDDIARMLLNNCMDFMTKDFHIHWRNMKDKEKYEDQMSAMSSQYWAMTIRSGDAFEDKVEDVKKVIKLNIHLHKQTIDEKYEDFRPIALAISQGKEFEICNDIAETDVFNFISNDYENFINYLNND